MPVSPTRDRVRGALLGLALGDAMGMPVDGLSHQNVRTYYKGIKGLTADEKRGARAGQWTAHTRRAFWIAGVLTEAAPLVDPHPSQERFGSHLGELAEASPVYELARTYRGRPSAAPAAIVAPFGVWAAARGHDDHNLQNLVEEVLPGWDTPAEVAALGQARAVALALRADPARLDGPQFVRDVADAVATGEWPTSGLKEGPHEWCGPVSERLLALAPHLDEMPLDLQDRCDGTGDRADEAFPFALAMVARGPDLVEATLLSAVNVGGAASAIGAMVGALLGAFNGWSAFPEEWRAGLEDADRLLAEADALADAVGL